MSRRLYLGRLPPDSRQEDVTKFFEGEGRIVDCRVMTGFGFVEFENSQDAELAMNNNGSKPFLGQNIIIEFAKESRPRERPAFDDRDRPRARHTPGHRVIVSGVSRETSWQDLKDFGREGGGSVSFADIDRDHPGDGILEYLDREDAERAVKDLDGKELRGNPVRVHLDETRGGPDNYRRGDRRDDPRPPRDDRDRYREDRSYARRDDSPPRRRDDRGEGRRGPRTPPPIDRDDRRRSPPPRREYEERRAGGYNDRRDDRRDGPGGGREDSYRRRDDRRDGRDDRVDERPPRSANGEPPV